MSPKTPPSRMTRLALARPRLWIAVALGVVAFGALTLLFGDQHVVTRALLAWDIGVLFYLVAVAQLMVRSTPAEIRRHAALQDVGAFAILVLTIAAAIASLIAIFVEFGAVERPAVQYGLYAAHAIVTVVLSWAFIHLIFALHYAHEFYGSGKRARGLDFPGDEPPDYWDFVYFSFVIGMTFQVSDVAVTNKWIRRTVVAHGVLAFFYTTAIIAMAVNIAGSAFSR